MNLGKLSLLSLATAGALALAGQASAFAPVWPTDGDAADGTDPAGSVVVWHGGASASTASMQSAVVSSFCDPAQPVDILEDARALGKPAFWSVACIVKPGVTGMTAGNKLLWSKRDEGGSGVGVGPVQMQMHIGYMKPSVGDTNGDGIVDVANTNCPTQNGGTRTIGGIAGVKIWNCTDFTYTWTATGVGSVAASINEAGPASDAVLRATDIGTSDIEPDKFASTFQLNVPSADMELNGVTDNILYDFNEPHYVSLGGIGGDKLPAHDTSNLAAAPAALLTFGVPVNVRMYQDLQRAQFPSGHPLYNDCNPDSGVSYGNITAAVYDGFGNATSGGILDARNNANLEKCMPSLTGNEIRSIAAKGGAIRSSTDMQFETMYGGASFTTLSAMAKGATSNAIAFCRRVNGSGTQAQFNAIMLGYPCDATGDGTIDTLVPATELAVVMLNEGSGDVEKCLNDFNDGTNTTSQNTALAKRWAIGVQSLEKNNPNLTTGVFSNKYRFIKVDGFAPTLANVHAGDYYDIASQSVQYNSSLPAARLAVASASFTALSTGLQNANNLPALNKTHAFGVASWLGIPSNSLASNIPTAALDLTRPVSWYRRVSGTNSGVSTFVNTCALPSMFNKTGDSSATVGPQNCTSNGGADGNCYTP